MELRLKPLLIILLLLLGGAAGAILWLPIGPSWSLPHFGEVPKPPVEVTLFPTTTQPGEMTSTPVKTSFMDSDSRWNWQWNPARDADLQKYLHQLNIASQITFTLAHDPTLPLGIAFPTVENAEAIVLTQCDGDSGSLDCTLSISKGETKEALEVATVAAMLYGVDEYARPKVQEAWEKQAAWDWNEFAPLVVEKEGRWQSNCLTISAE